MSLRTYGGGAVCMRLILRQLNLHPLHHPVAAAAHHQNDELDVYTIGKKASSYIALSVLCMYIRGETRRTTQRPSLDVMNEPCHSPARAECIIRLYTQTTDSLMRGAQDTANSSQLLWPPITEKSSSSI